ncbi:putative efflux protein, MATE family [Ferrithrix thermotolerans DSM 19514]|uniref:Putative efflux protein, MATE family n=1 Tax=Ferrithrix thermotolerans DSM 19514 TaxID=1121881 RepID=A0A1M4TDV4_9ACTN|nr:MATE family efflux transporter [Ferrithrix thermotolerans]SHE42666.1 putative efflux protein, MATE family [Ferrithrix thermotolerans DSM 19514]
MRHISRYLNLGTPEFRAELIGLAVPTLVSLIAEPVFLLVDSVIVGHLGTTALAALGAAGAIITLINATFIFLTYSTTSLVARSLGQDSPAEARKWAASSMVLALCVGISVSALAYLSENSLLGLVGTPTNVLADARTYLNVSLLGVPATLLTYSALGSLRGFKMISHSAKIQVAGYVLNAVLDYSLVFGARLGILGAAVGTTIVQFLVAASYLYTTATAMSFSSLSMRTVIGSLRSSLRHGSGLTLRTITLRLAILLATWVAAKMGSTSLAAQQVLSSIWTFAAFALDSVAIALQVIVGHSIGAKDTEKTRTFTRWGMNWSLVIGVALAIPLVVLRVPLSHAFTTSKILQHVISHTLIVVSVLQPLAGLVYLLDGVLIGSGDGDFLALAGAVSTAAFVPAALLVHYLHPSLDWLWLAYGWFMFCRFLTLGCRERGDAWITRH